MELFSVVMERERKQKETKTKQQKKKHIIQQNWFKLYLLGKGWKSHRELANFTGWEKNSTKDSIKTMLRRISVIALLGNSCSTDTSYVCIHIICLYTRHIYSSEKWAGTPQIDLVLKLSSHGLCVTDPFLRNCAAFLDLSDWKKHRC